MNYPWYIHCVSPLTEVDIYTGTWASLSLWTLSASPVAPWKNRTEHVEGEPRAPKKTIIYRDFQYQTCGFIMDKYG